MGAAVKCTTAGNLSEHAKQFWLCVYDMPTVEKLRDLKTRLVGRLTTISGTVTRTSEVRPELLEGSFQCLECSTSIEGVVQQYKYTEPQICTNPACGNRKKWCGCRSTALLLLFAAAGFVTVQMRVSSGIW